MEQAEILLRDLHFLRRPFACCLHAADYSGLAGRHHGTHGRIGGQNEGEKMGTIGPEWTTANSVTLPKVGQR